MNYLDKKITTITDIAKKANVSIATVSRVINNSGRVKLATKKKVEQVIKEENFVPNAVARSLANKKNCTIGFMFPDILHPAYGAFVKTVEQTASEKGFLLMLFLISYENQKLDYYINEMLERRIDGLLMAGIQPNGKEAIIENAQRFMPIVSIQSDIPGVDRIDCTDEQGTYELTNYLIQNGHQKIGFIGYRFDYSIMVNRFAGYKRALEMNNIPYRKEYFSPCTSDKETSYDAAVKLLELKDPPTAIHCSNESLAYYVYTAAKERGLKVPQDLSITSFDSESYAELMVPQTTTIEQPIRQMGEMAMERLFKQIEEDSSIGGVQISMPTRLAKRQSVWNLNTQTLAL